MAQKTSTGTPAGTAKNVRHRSGGLKEAIAEAFSLWRSDCEVNKYFEPRLTLAIWRMGQALSGRPGLACFLARRVVQVADFVWVRGFIGGELPPQVRVGRRLHLLHAGRGVFVSTTSVIGDDCVLHHEITLGYTDSPIGPSLGNGVKMGAKAAAIGPIHLADGTRVGTSAVVTKDTEPYGTYVGVPARLISRRTPPGTPTDRDDSD